MKPTGKPALAIAMVSFWRGVHRAKTSNEKRDPFGERQKTLNN